MLINFESRVMGVMICNCCIVMCLVFGFNFGVSRLMNMFVFSIKMMVILSNILLIRVVMVFIKGVVFF